MKRIHEQTKLVDILILYPSLIPFVNRFGIRLGVGDKTVKMICKENNIQVEFFCMAVNILLFSDYRPDVKLQNFSILQIVDYLKRTHSDYLSVQLANIERHIQGLIRSAQNNNLGLIDRFFQEYKNEISTLIRKEEEEMFPHIQRVYELFYSPQYDLSYEGDLSLSVRQFGDEYEAVNEKLLDLKSIIIKYLQGSYDANVCYAVIVSLNHLEEDMNSHLRLQELLLKPMVLDMEISIRKRGGRA